MMRNVAHLIARMFLLLAVVVLVTARPQHFGDANQVVGDQDQANAIGSPSLSDGQLEMLAQKLAEYNNQVPSAGWDPRWDRIVRAPEMKRQSRFRQCYFNPVSCFKK